MTALKWITNEARKLRTKDKGRKEWKKYVAQASAIYASKHKGKSPIGKKHKRVTVKRVAGKKRVAAVRKPSGIVSGISQDHSTQRILMKAALMKKGINVAPNISDSDLQSAFRKLTGRKVPSIHRIRKMIKAGKSNTEILNRM